jgi:hypothetical protein
MNESREIRIPVPGSGVLIDCASQAERDRSLRLAEARQELAHRGCFLPPWPALTDKERELAAGRGPQLAPRRGDRRDRRRPAPGRPGRQLRPHRQRDNDGSERPGAGR